MNRPLYSFLILLSCLLLPWLMAAQPHKVDRLRTLIEAAPEDDSKVELLNQLSAVLISDDPVMSAEEAWKAWNLAKQLDLKNLENKSLLQLGTAMLRANDYDSALVYLTQVIAEAEQQKDYLTLYKAKIREVESLRMYGDVQSAFTKSFGVLSKIDSLGYTELRWDILRNIGEGYRYQEDGNNAIKYYKLAIQAGQKTGQLQGAFTAERNMASAMKQIGKNDEAVEILSGLHEKYGEALSRIDSARVYSNLGNILLDQEKWKEAEVALKKGWALAKTTKFAKSKAYLLKELGYLYNETNQPEKTIYYNNIAWEMAKEINHLFLLRDVTGTLSHAYKKVGNYDLAFEMLREQRSYSEALMGQEQIALAQEMEKKYEAEKREQQIQLKNEQLARQEATLSQQTVFRNALLGGVVLLLIIAALLYRNQHLKTKKNQEIEKQNQAIEASLREKESLLKEIHHRVKNNLQVISSLLNMQSRGTDSPEMLEAIQEGQSRVKAMSLIHQKLYQTDNLSEIDFQDYISQLVDQLANLYKKSTTDIENRIEAKGIMLDIDTAIPLGLILNELISNAYKYAFNGSEKGLIEVALNRLNDGQLQLNVSDNGEGLPQDFDLEKTKSLGLKLVNILTKQLHGELSYEMQNGSNFKIIFNEIKMTA